MFEIEGVSGDWGREELAVQAFAKDPGGSPGSVGAQSISEALYRRRGSHIEIIKEPLRNRKEVVKGIG
jgi:hypothetical protein